MGQTAAKKNGCLRQFVDQGKKEKLSISDNNFSSFLTGSPVLTVLSFLYISRIFLTLFSTLSVIWSSILLFHATGRFFSPFCFSLIRPFRHLLFLSSLPCLVLGIFQPSFFNSSIFRHSSHYAYSLSSLSHSRNLLDLRISHSIDSHSPKSCSPVNHSHCSVFQSLGLIHVQTFPLYVSLGRITLSPKFFLRVRAKNFFHL